MTHTKKQRNKIYRKTYFEIENETTSHICCALDNLFPLEKQWLNARTSAIINMTEWLYNFFPELILVSPEVGCCTWFSEDEKDNGKAKEYRLTILALMIAMTE